MTSKIEKNSETWRSVDKWATDRLEKYRRQLEADGRTEAEYSQLRARIAEMKALLNLPTEEQQ